MNVDATEPWDVEHGLRQDQTVSDDDHDVGPITRELRDRRWITQLRGLLDVQVVRGRALLDRAHRHLLTATRRSIRLRINGHDAMTRSDQRCERRHGKLGRARKDDSE